MMISGCKKQITALHLSGLQLLIFLILQLIGPNLSIQLPSTIAGRWKEINGERNWEGLLDPLDLDLRYNILLYGEMSQAIYDTFVGEKKSKFAGAPRFSRKHFLDSVTATFGQARLYEVTKYIYATSSIPVPESWFLWSLSREAWSKESNWMGFVAVATDAGKEVLGRRDILVGWRGTIETIEWAKDFDSTMVPATDIVPPGPNSGRKAKVHRGFLSVYTSNDTRSPYNKESARNQVLGEVRRLVQAHERENVSITLTGHSLGSALSTICAMDIVTNGINKPKSALRRDTIFPVAAFAFGSPKVGNAAFSYAFAHAPGLRLLNIRNKMDPVTVYPILGYTRTGVELLIDFRNSPYLKMGLQFQMWHNLECYLHGVAGTRGIKRQFKLAIDRDVALVNKAMDALKKEYLVPASWWSPENKGMIQGADGHWTLQDHEEDGPPY